MKTKITVIAVVLGAMGSAHSAVPAEEAARLGKELTPWGAEKAGNKEGTIPAYTGGLAVDLMGPDFDSSKSVKDGRQFQPDPFKDDKPLFRITQSNLDQYADKLTDAVKALFKNSPAFYMDVYPTRRSVNYPKYYVDSSIKNATRCKLIESSLTLKGCKGGVPFPIPKSGPEVMWNLQLAAYKGPAGDVNSVATYVDRAGNITATAYNSAYWHYPFQDPRYSLEDFENPSKPYHGLFYQISALRLGPSRIAGEVTLVKLATDERNAMSWTYQPGNRRVRTSPNVEYDFPVPSAGGAGFYDEGNVFSGNMGRFDWKLMGKKEMIMPYNNYRLPWADMKDAMKAQHPNPALLRWELHRAWVVEATRKPGVSHAFAKRRYYVDEDSPLSAMGDQYDDSGKIARGNFSSTNWIWDYQQGMPYAWNSDVVNGAQYYVAHPGNGTKVVNAFRDPETLKGGFTPDGKMYSDFEWTPEGISRRSQR